MEVLFDAFDVFDVFVVIGLIAWVLAWVHHAFVHRTRRRTVNIPEEYTNSLDYPTVWRRGGNDDR